MDKYVSTSIPCASEYAIAVLRLTANSQPLLMENCSLEASENFKNTEIGTNRRQKAAWHMKFDAAKKVLDKAYEKGIISAEESSLLISDWHERFPSPPTPEQLLA
jgi:hypothetical protein